MTPKLRIFLLSTLLLTVVACSVEKDVFTARLYHRMVSKYNILFNGKQTLIKLEEQFRNGHQENFQELLPVFIVPDENAASAAKPDLERMIAKGTKLISRHSMMIRNEQKNNYIDDSYLLIGIARYYDRDYLKALETFNYVIQEFPHNHEERVAAEMWAGRTETALENYLPAEDRFQAVYRDKHTPEDLKDDIFAAYAQLEIDRDRNTNAYQLITQAIEKADDRFQKLRWMYLAAQLQESLGNDYEASQLFAKVIKSGPPYEYLFNAQLSRARSFDVDVQDPAQVYEDLEKMLEDEKNYDNRDKIYYVMAEVANKLEEEEQVVYFLKQSIRVSTKNKEQKGLSYLWLAEMNFDERLYETAQAYYDSSYQNLPTDHPKYDRVKGLVESLNALVDNLKTIRLQDSLQALAHLSEGEREAVANQIIEALRQKEEEEALAAQRAQMDQLALNSQGGGPAGLAGASGGDAGKFYFYNATVRSRGVSAFNQRWGSRKLEDNWRRKDKGGSALIADRGPGNEAATEEGDSAVKQTGGNPKYETATYLKDVPLSPEAMAASHLKIQKALFNNALLYKEQIIDFLSAAESLKEILRRYPNFEEKAKVYYFLYRIYDVAENEALAEQYKQKVLQEFPQSNYAYLILNGGQGQEGADIVLIKSLYDEVYRAFEQKAYRESLQKSTEGHQKYASSEFGPMFALVKALSQGYLGQKESFTSSLQKVIDQYPQTEQAKKASDILAQVAPAQQGEEPAGEAGQKYQTDFSANHRFVVVFPNKGRVSGNDINITLSDFNRKYYPNDPLRSKAMLLGTEQQLVTVSGFPNKRRAMQYLGTLQNEKVLNDALISVDNEQFVISNANFSVFYVGQDIKGYLSFFKEHYSKQES